MSHEFQPKPQRRLARPEVAIALSGALALGGAGIANAQENPEPSLQPNPSLEILPTQKLCTSSKITEEMPIPSAAPEITLSNGDTLIFESPTPSALPEPSLSVNLNEIETNSISAYDKLLNMINNKGGALDAYRETYPKCDFNLIIENINTYYDSNPEIKKLLDEQSASVGKIEDIMESSKKELDKKRINKRNSLGFSITFHTLAYSFNSNEDPNLIPIMYDFLGVTLPELDSNYGKATTESIKMFKDKLNTVRTDE